ncbi:MAG TPA: ABC transporter permease [Actinomycetota bacterium]
MNVFVEALAWLADPEHWSGPNGIPTRLLEHVQLSAAGLGIAAATALPIGLVVGHARSRRGEVFAVQAANAARAVPTFAVLVLVYVLMLEYRPSLAFGFVPTVVALVLLGIPPILVNTTVGVRAVDADLRESATGMGMSGRQLLRWVEVPLSAPLVVTGLRIAALQIVATATLAAFIAGGGLGRYIRDGYAQQEPDMMIAGAYLVALLALATEGLFWLLTRATRPERIGGGRR